MEVFVRQKGLLGGVCGGLAVKLRLNVVLLRFLMLVSAFFSLGLTIILYLAAVFAFPNRLTVQLGERPVFLGVCHRISRNLKLHESWLRFLVLVLWIFTGFIPVFAVYMIVFLALGGVEEQSYRRPDSNDSRVRDVN
jgi:phage shock protein PspC (stress-responsive transcriptional regulator)